MDTHGMVKWIRTTVWLRTAVWKRVTVARGFMDIMVDMHDRAVSTPHQDRPNWKSQINHGVFPSTPASPPPDGSLLPPAIP